MTERSIFSAALDRTDPAERSAFLDQACDGDAALRQRIEQLLKSHEEPGSFLEKPAMADGVTGEFTPDPSGKEPTAPPSLTEGPGTRIGPYKLLQRLGEGGMGAVFLAEQEQPVRRRVALKIIKAGMDSAQVVARFEQERQALAMMDHPNIAKVLDAGQTATGRPFFVMELVKGIPITKYCDQEHLTPTERLELFIPVCQAVHHAHQKGIVHRDLKPSNVLIALYDGRPVPKVIDFGVAKASSQKLTERTMFTEVGSIIGTLEYMAPEQAELNNLDIDTRADIYSLGVVLYELLTGSTPFSAKQLRNAAFTEMLQIIREVEPLKPSNKLSSSQELAGIAAKRKLEPKRLTRLVHGDLDWITMKCLEKDRVRRYESASGLAADIERYLHNEPVLAGAPSTAYKLRKFLRRNKGPVVAAALVLLMLLFGAAVSTWQAVRATQAEHEALAAQSVAGEQSQVATQQRDEARQANANLRNTQEELRTTLYTAQMNRIQNAWDADSIVQVRNLLTQVKPKAGEKDLRGFEWYYWDRLSHSELRTLDLGPQAPTAMWFSPDGTRLAAVVGPPPEALLSPSAKSEFRVWDTATGRQLLSFELAIKFMSKLAFSSDGKRLASTTESGAMVWNADNGKTVCAIKAAGEITTLVFDSDRKRLAGIVELPGKKRKTPVELKVWDAATGDVVASCALSSDPAIEVMVKSQLTFTPDGKRVAVVVYSSKGKDEDLDVVKFWDAATGKEVASCQVAADMDEGIAVSPSVVPAKLNFSPDGKRFAVPVLMLGTKPPDDANFNIQEMMKLMSSAKGGVQIWDLDSGKQIRTIKGLRANSNNVVFSPDGKQLVALDTASGDLRVWNAATGQEQFNIINNPGRVSAVSSGDPKGMGFQRTLGEMGVVFSPDGKLFAVTGFGTTIRVWNAATGELRLNLLGHKGTVTSVAFSPDQKTIYSAGTDGVMKAWDTSVGRELPKFTGSLTLSPDGRRAAELIVLESTEKPADPSKKAVPAQGLRMWDTANWMELYTLKRTAAGTYFGSLAFSHDGKRLAAVSTDMPPAMGLFFGPMQDFMRIIMTKGKQEEKESEIWILDAATGRELSSFKAALGMLPRLTFSPNGKQLASAPLGTKDPPAIKVWDAQTGKVVLTIAAPAPPADVVFSSDSKRLVGVMAPNPLAKGAKEISMEVKLWDAETGKEVGALQVAGMVAGVPTFSPDGKSLATIHMSDNALSGLASEGVSFVRTWDVASGKERALLRGTNRLIQVVAFSPDGSRIATAGMDVGPGQRGNEVTIWDTHTGAELLTLKTDIIMPAHLAFSPAGDRLMLTGQSGIPLGASVLQIWDATPRVE